MQVGKGEWKRKFKRGSAFATLVLKIGQGLTRTRVMCHADHPWRRPQNAEDRERGEAVKEGWPARRENEIPHRMYHGMSQRSGT